MTRNSCIWPNNYYYYSAQMDRVKKSSRDNSDDEFTYWCRLVTAVRDDNSDSLQKIIVSNRQNKNSPQDIIMSREAKLLHYAIQKRRTRIAIELMNMCTSSELGKWQKRTLYPAVYHGNEDVCRYLLGRSGIDPSRDESLALRYALKSIFEHKTPDTIPMVFINRDFSTEHGRSTFRGKYINIIKLLTFDGRSNIEPQKYSIALVAATFGDYELFRKMIDAHDVDIFYSNNKFLGRLIEEKKFVFMKSLLTDYAEQFERLDTTSRKDNRPLGRSSHHEYQFNSKEKSDSLEPGEIRTRDHVNQFNQFKPEEQICDNEPNRIKRLRNEERQPRPIESDFDFIMKEVDKLAGHTSEPPIKKQKVNHDVILEPDSIPEMQTEVDAQHMTYQHPFFNPFQYVPYPYQQQLQQFQQFPGMFYFNDSNMIVPIPFDHLNPYTQIHPHPRFDDSAHPQTNL